MTDTGTFCATEDVTKAAGNGANSSAIAEAYTNAFVDKAEGFIMAACRYDFKTNYASISTIIKSVLKEATAALAACYCIQWDMFGYTTLEEATTMLNFLKLRFNECVNLLADGQTRAAYGY